MANKFWVGGGSSTNASATGPTNWSLSSGGTNNAAVPTTGDAVLFNGVGTNSQNNCVWNLAVSLASMDFTGYTGTFSGSSAITLTGVTFKFSTGMTVTYTGTITFTGSSTTTITSNGKTFSGNLIFSGLSGTRTLADALTINSTHSLTIGGGTFNIASKALSVGQILSSGSAVRTISNPGTTWTLTGTGIVFDFSAASNLTVAWPTNIDHNNASATACTWSGPLISNRVISTMKRSAGSGSLALTSIGSFGAIDLTGYTGTALTGNINANGSVTLPSSLTSASTISVTFDHTSGTKNLTMGSISTAISIVLNAPGGTLQLQDTLTTLGNLSVSAGTLDVNTQSVTVGSFSSSVVTSFTNLSVISNSMVVGATQTISGTLTLTGLDAALNRLEVQSSDLGVSATLSATSVVLTNVDFRDITGSGSATWSGTSVGDRLGNSGITFTTPIICYWVATSGGLWSATSSWSSSSGGSPGARVPLPQDDAHIDTNSISSGSRTITVDMDNVGKNIDFSAVTNTPLLDFTSDDHIVFGSLTLGTLTTSNANIIMGTRSSANLSGSSATINGSLAVSALGGTVSLTSDLLMGITTTDLLAILAGTLTIGAHNITTGTFYVDSSGHNVTINAGSATCLASQGWDIADASNLTFNAQTSTIKINDNSLSTAGLFIGGNLVYNNFWYDGSGAGVEILGSNTFNDLKCTNPGAFFIIFDDNSTTTFTTLTVSGTAGNLVTLTSNSGSGTPHSLHCTSGIISCDYLDLIDSHASGGASFYAGTHSVDGGGNLGWNFTGPGISVTSDFGCAIEGLLSVLTNGSQSLEDTRSVITNSNLSTENLFGQTRDSGTNSEIGLSIKSDSSVSAENLTPFRSDNCIVIENALAARTDGGLLTENLFGQSSDSPGTLENSSTVRSDKTVAAEGLLQSRSDSLAPLEDLGTLIINSDAVVPVELGLSVTPSFIPYVEFSSSVLRDLQSPLESLSSFERSSPVPVENLLGVRRDSPLTEEITVGLLSNIVLSQEVIAGFLRDSFGPTEILNSVIRNQSIPIEFSSLVVGSSPANAESLFSNITSIEIHTELLCSVLSDSRIYTEEGRSTISDSPTGMEFIGTLSPHFIRGVVNLRTGTASVDMKTGTSTVTMTVIPEEP